MLRVLRDRFRGLFGHDRIAGEIAEELRHHEDLLTERLISEGQSPDEARRQAQRRLGRRATLQDAGYDVRGGGALEAFVQDIRYGARRLRAAPGFTAIAILTLALGIGANTAIFSVASGVLLRPLPYADPDRLAMVWMDNARIKLREDWHSYPNYADYRDQSATFAGMAVFNDRDLTLTSDGAEPERLTGAHASANLFEVLGASPEIGRLFTREEDDGSAAVVVLSHRLWQRRFGSNPGVINSSIVLGGRSVQIVGVMPDGFAFPAPNTDFWVPTSPSQNLRTARNSLWLQVIGRLKPGVTVEQAQHDLGAINARILQAFPNQKGYGVNVVNYREQMVGRIRPMLIALLSAVGLLLLIACTNVAGLLLARVSIRQREVALRAALGAGRGRIVRQLLTESLLLGLLGGAGGLVMGWLGVRALVSASPDDLPRLTSIAVDGRVLMFTTAVAVLTGLLFGLVPALQTAKADPVQTIKEGGRGSTGFGRRLRRGLVAAEVALAVVLLVGAGLMLRSLAAMQRVDLGIRTDHVWTARVSLSGTRYREAPARIGFYEQLIARTQALPNVDGAAAIGTIFLSETPNSTNFSIEGRPDFTPDEAVEVPVDSITPDYFRVLGVPLLQGRFFGPQDTATSPSAVIINATMAKQFWPGENPLGRRMKYGQLSSGAPWLTIVGIVADTRRTGYEAAVRPETYLPHAQNPNSSMLLVVRTPGDPLALSTPIRGIIRQLDPSAPLQQVKALDDEVAEMMAGRRLNTTLFAVFAAVAVLLAAVGVYGVMAGSVEQRTREFGVRLALGASSTKILRMVLVEALWIVGAGLVVGLGGALALGRTINGLLYHVRPTDPLTLTAIAGLTLVVAVMAAVVPAARALRLNPVTALRDS